MYFISIKRIAFKAYKETATTMSAETKTEGDSGALGGTSPDRDPCWFFNTPQGCRKGTECEFAHVANVRPKPRPCATHGCTHVTESLQHRFCDACFAEIQKQKGFHKCATPSCQKMCPREYCNDCWTSLQSKTTEKKQEERLFKCANDGCDQMTSREYCDTCWPLHRLWIREQRKRQKHVTDY